MKCFLKENKLNKAFQEKVKIVLLFNLVKRQGASMKLMNRSGANQLYDLTAFLSAPVL